MKVKVKREVEIEIAFVRMSVAVRYEEEDMPNDFPFRNGDIWDVTINIETGVIEGWPAGVQHELHMKVCDEGSYWLLDPERNVVASIEDDYVPNDLIPGSYGDYIEVQIDETGKITNWCKKPDVSEFFED